MKQYKLLIFGKGGHGAEPHMAIDSTIIASEFVRKSLKYKNIEIVSVKSGDAFNVISGKAEIVLKTDNINFLTKKPDEIWNILHQDGCSFKEIEIQNRTLLDSIFVTTKENGGDK